VTLYKPLRQWRKGAREVDMNDFEKFIIEELRQLREEIRDQSEDISEIKQQIAGWKARVTLIGGLFSTIMSIIVGYLIRR
jgi:cell division septum initiation protein DivIVA